MKNERDHIDDLFKKKLEGYKAQPSQAIWKGIVHKFLNPHLGTIRLLNLQNIILAVALIGTGVSVYFVWPSITAEKKSKEPISGEIIPNPSGNSSIEIPIETVNVSREMQPIIPEQKPGPTDQAKPIEAAETLSHNINNLQKNESDVATENRLQGGGLTSENPLIEKVSLPFADEKRTDYRTQTKPIGIIPLKNVQKDYFRNVRPRHQPDLPQQPVQWNDDYGRAAQLSASVYFLPEWINYHKDGKFQSSYTQEILATFQSRNFILRSGLGISRAQDDGNYTAYYNRYEQVGYFFGVNYFTGVDGYPDSVTFETYVNEIYDSVNYNTSYRTDNAYTYLQIPLQLGYRFISFKGLSLYLVGGPCFSYLLSQKETNPSFDIREATLVSMENQTPLRRKNNWQLMLGLGTQYSITDKFSIMVEPMYRQFLKSAYNGNTSDRPPYSFGIRAGLTYHF